jgi:hypothetical protein
LVGVIRICQELPGIVLRVGGVGSCQDLSGVVRISPGVVRHHQDVIRIYQDFIVRTCNSLGKWHDSLGVNILATAVVRILPGVSWRFRAGCVGWLGVCPEDLGKRSLGETMNRCRVCTGARTRQGGAPSTSHCKRWSGTCTALCKSLCRLTRCGS